MEGVAVCTTHPVLLRVVEEVAPVWIGLHEPELKQFSHDQIQDTRRYLEGETVKGKGGREEEGREKGEEGEETYTEREEREREREVWGRNRN